MICSNCKRENVYLLSLCYNCLNKKYKCNICGEPVFGGSPIHDSHLASLYLLNGELKKHQLICDRCDQMKFEIRRKFR